MHSYIIKLRKYILKKSKSGERLINFRMIMFFEINYFQLTIASFFAGDLVAFLV
jgi:hypothetical protein